MRIDPTVRTRREIGDVLHTVPSKSTGTHGTPTSGTTYNIESRGCRTTPPVPGGIWVAPRRCRRPSAPSPPRSLTLLPDLIQFWSRSTAHGLPLAPGSLGTPPLSENSSPHLSSAELRLRTANAEEASRLYSVLEKVQQRTAYPVCPDRSNNVHDQPINKRGAGAPTADTEPPLLDVVREGRGASYFR